VLQESFRIKNETIQNCEKIMTGRNSREWEKIAKHKVQPKNNQRDIYERSFAWDYNYFLAAQKRGVLYIKSRSQQQKKRNRDIVPQRTQYITAQQSMGTTGVAATRAIPPQKRVKPAGWNVSCQTYNHFRHHKCHNYNNGWQYQGQKFQYFSCGRH